MAKGVLQGKGLPAQPTYSRQFAVQVNDHVARSLGLTLDAGELVTRLRQLEGSP
jgi:putative tryptophan/tyrosine transport system substrate-binding protein